MDYKIYVQYQDCANVVDIYIFAIDANGKRSLCTSIDTMTFIEHTESLIIEKPTIKISGFMAQPFLQAMADTLEKHGVRPKGKPVLENELTAVKYHLEDMRKLVFAEPIVSGVAK